MMSDIMSPEKRSRVMSRIRGKDTEPEVKVRLWLYSHGIRYRKNWRELPGTPDIAITKGKIAVFINGCFWHGHEGCKAFVIPKTRTEWWLHKINSTRKRDYIKNAELESIGWTVLTIWECEIEQCFETCMNKLYGAIRLSMISTR